MFIPNPGLLSSFSSAFKYLHTSCTSSSTSYGIWESICFSSPTKQNVGRNFRKELKFFLESLQIDGTYV